MSNELLNQTGRIFDIQRFSVHDGSGIRTIIFFKGCILKCRWCCNPEGQRYSPEEMNVNGKIKNVGRDVTVGELLEIIKKDSIYYRRSGGGVTLSGGEFLTQPDFAYALLKSCKENGINTAVETTACTDWINISKVLPYIDCFLMDIKHINSEKHKEFTSKPNELILENAVKIAENGKKLIIRVPVIPTFNDTIAEIEEIAKFTATLKGVKQLHLLPYHRLGMDKYKWLGREYLMGDLQTPPKEKIRELSEVVEKYGLKCIIGG